MAGGGTIFVNIIPAVEALLDSVEGRREDRCSDHCQGLEAPIRQIAANAGLDGSVILEKVRNSGKNWATASTPTRRSTATWSPPVSSIPPR